MKSIKKTAIGIGAVVLAMMVLLFLIQFFYIQHLANENHHMTAILKEVEMAHEELGGAAGAYHTQEMTIVYNEMEKLFHEVKDMRWGVGAQLKNGYIFFTSIILMIVILFVVVLIYLLIRMVDVDLAYMIHVFKNLNHRKYNDKESELKCCFEEEEKIKHIVMETYEEQKLMEEIRAFASSEYILDDVLEKIFNKVQKVFQVDRIGVAFVDYESKKMIAETGKFKYDHKDILLGPGYEVSFSNTSLTNLIESKKPVIISDLTKEWKKRSNSLSLQLIVKEGIQSNMIIPLLSGNVVFGFMFFSSLEANTYHENHLRLAENISHVVSSIIDKTYFTKIILHNITATFANVVESRDYETGYHINRMTDYSTIIAEALLEHPDENYRIDKRFIKDLKLYAPLHDIGKVGIPDVILKKPDQLTNLEWQIMKEHTVIGASILQKLNDNLKIFKKPFFDGAIEVAKYHHEKWDGTGYPEGLKRQQIPLAARIVAIADVFDAVSSKRPYKKAFSFEESVKIIQEGSGTHFDKELVRVFLNCLPQIREVYTKEYPQNSIEIEMLENIG